MVGDTQVETRADTVDNSTHHLLSRVATERQVEDMAAREVHRLLDGIKRRHQTQTAIFLSYREIRDRQKIVLWN
jgi:hypothetical protein